MHLKSRNVNNAFEDLLWHFKVAQLPTSNTRNGKVKRLADPLSLTYHYPRERILWAEKRDANPFFHLMESIWMIAGRNDLASIVPYNKGMANYADMGGLFHGAYGYRWQHAFGFDQIESIVRMLTNDPDTRRAALAMWEPQRDLGCGMSKDLPCNTHAYFDIQDDDLCMTVCNRSNDVVWGMLGANVVHFSMLQELMAELLGYPIGTYTQFTNNAHIYEQHWHLITAPPTAEGDPYLRQNFAHPTLTVDRDIRETRREYNLFLDGEQDGFHAEILQFVAVPMRDFYLDRDVKVLQEMIDCDWKLAALQWAERHQHVSQ